MTTEIVQDWTQSNVALSRGQNRDVRYLIYKHGARLFQEIRDLDDSPIHTLELPDGLVLQKSSYEVMLRYVLTDLVSS